MKNESTNKNNNIIKIILLGNTETGKTSLINAYDGKDFAYQSLSTIGSTFIKKEVKINDKVYNVQIWDTAGQEKYRSVNKIYIKGSQIVIFVYDVTNAKSFSDLSSFWVDYVEKILGNDATIGVCGTKIDLDKVEVSTEEGKKFAEKIGALFGETSSLQHPNGVIEFINQLVDKYISIHLNDNNQLRQTFNLNDNKKKIKNENKGIVCC